MYTLRTRYNLKIHVWIRKSNTKHGATHSAYYLENCVICFQVIHEIGFQVIFGNLFPSLLCSQICTFYHQDLSPTPINVAFILVLSPNRCGSPGPRLLDCTLRHRCRSQWGVTSGPGLGPCTGARWTSTRPKDVVLQNWIMACHEWISFIPIFHFTNQMQLQMQMQMQMQTASKAAWKSVDFERSSKKEQGEYILT